MIRSIYTRLVAFIILLVVLSIGASGYYSYYLNSNVMTTQVKNEEDAILNVSGYYIDTLLANYENQLNEFAASDVALNLSGMKENEGQILDYLGSYIKTIPNAINLYIGTADGKFYLYPVQDLPADYDPRARDWYKQANSASGKIIWTDVYKDAVSNKNEITVAKQIKDSAGNVIGVAGIDIDLSYLSDELGNIKVGDTGYVFLIDRNGVTLAHPDKSNLGVDMNQYDWGREILSGGKSGSLNYKFNGVDKYATYQTIERLGWKIVATLPYSEITASSSGILRSSVMSGGIFILISILISLLIARSIVSPINKLKKSLSYVENGDFSQKTGLKSKDELGQLASYFDNAIESVRMLIYDIRNVAEKVKQETETLSFSVSQTASATEEIAKAVEDVASGASAQATDVQEISGVVEDLSKSISKVKEAAEDVSMLSHDSLLLSQEGKKVVDTLVERNWENVEANRNVIKSINELNERSKQIGNIIETINAIADQTNLLALNAAIEAARAGEAGRGFAVVADEIRKLAEQSSKAVLQVQELISGIEKNVNDSVSNAEKTKEINKDLTESVKNTSSAFAMISESLGKAMKSIEKVIGMMDEMNKLREKAVEGVDNISAVSEETAASSEEVSASSEEQNAALEEINGSLQELKDMTDKLFDAISKFKV
ncbi:MAG: methyl-accepting chemotaxis protein [Thermoanaerobacteraceae bacterium]|nr:methyl-accepting chemotaxis protein [Thermoanaerobacteraceae bacterium]